MIESRRPGGALDFLAAPPSFDSVDNGDLAAQDMLAFLN
jgi:hypothetical protein